VVNHRTDYYALTFASLALGSVHKSKCCFFTKSSFAFSFYLNIYISDTNKKTGQSLLGLSQPTLLSLSSITQKRVSLAKDAKVANIIGNTSALNYSKKLW